MSSTTAALCETKPQQLTEDFTLVEAENQETGICTQICISCVLPAALSTTAAIFLQRCKTNAGLGIAWLMQDMMHAWSLHLQQHLLTAANDLQAGLLQHLHMQFAGELQSHRKHASMFMRVSNTYQHTNMIVTVLRSYYY